jgi:hypothetical protein
MYTVIAVERVVQTLSDPSGVWFSIDIEEE